MNRSYSKIRHIQESNRLLEERMLNDKRILNEQSNDGWLTYGNDKNYQYKKVGNDWVAKNVKTNKEYNLTQLSNNPKYAGYKTSISNLEKTFPGGKPKGDANANSNVNGTGDVINTLPPKSLQTLDGKPVASSPTPLNTGGGTTQPVQYKNEKLPDAPVYYPWIQDGKLNTEKLKQSIEDNSINKWLDELKKLTPEQLTKVRQDLKSSGIPTNLTTTKGTGLYYNLNELLKIAEKSLQTPATVSPTGPTGTSLDKNKLPTGDIKSNSVNLMGGVTSQSTVSSPGGAVFALKAGMTGVGNRQDTAAGKTYVVNKVTPLQCDLIEVEFKNKANRLEYGYYQPSIYKTNSISFRRKGEGVKSANPCTEYNTFGDFGNLEFS